MSSDLQLDLTNYRLQLQQVEASLELDKDNEELLKLKIDLEEVIKLTLDLIGKSLDDYLTSDKTSWKKGEHCMAMWSKDRHYYPAMIDEILEDGTCQVTFDNYDRIDICQLALLKPIVMANQLNAKKRKKDDRSRQVEHKKRKLQKKIDKQQEIETICELERSTWKTFNKKMQKQGKLRKSIFASPETIKGRVGVGTCGISGKPMTQFSHRHNYLRK